MHFIITFLLKPKENVHFFQVRPGIGQAIVTHENILFFVKELDEQLQ
jgi:hypothetical protein